MFDFFSTGAGEFEQFDRRRADINAQAGGEGYTALMISAEAGDLDCVKYLREQGAI